MTSIVHKFKKNGVNIVLDTNSGTVHIVSDIVYDMLDLLTPPLSDTMPDISLQGYSREDMQEAYEDILELYREKMLFSECYDPVLSPDRKIPIKALCLHIAHDCNMRCEYCFASTGEYKHGRELMPFETGKAAIDYLMKNSLHIKNLEVDFFGGEPLMNLDVVKQIVAYTREKEKEYGKNVRFTMTTNGVLLDDETIDFLNAEMSNVVLSIDGRRQVNDKMRPLCDGSGSYDLILPQYKKLVERRRGGKYTDHYVRGTFTHENLDFASDVLHLYSEGFDQISVEPVVLPDDNKYAIKEEDIPRICEEYDRLTDEIAKIRAKGEFINFFHFMIDLDGGPCVYKRIKGCGSGSEYLAVTPKGDIYPCHQFADNDDFKLGNVFETSSTDDVRRSEFHSCNITSKEECKKCFAKYFCGGGCAANNYNFNGSIDKPYKTACELEKKRVECALYLKALEAKE